MAKAKAEPGLTERMSVGLPRRIAVGECYYFYGPRYDFLGRVVSIDGPYTVTLEDAVLVMDAGRVHEFFRDGRAAQTEMEPVGVIGVQWVAWRPWPHALPTEAV